MIRERAGGIFRCVAFLPLQHPTKKTTAMNAPIDDRSTDVFQEFHCDECGETIAGANFSFRINLLHYYGVGTCMRLGPESFLGP